MDIDIDAPMHPSPTGEPDPASLAHALRVCASGALVVGVGAGADFPILYANPAFLRLSARGAASLCTLRAALLDEEDNDTALAAALAAALREGSDQQLLLPCHRPDRSVYWCQLLLSPVPNRNGHISHLVCLLDDVTDARLRAAQLAHLASHDDLTGLANRSLFHQRLQLAMAGADADPAGKGVAVIGLALDGFNLVSESLGYVAGDQLLVGVALRLQGSLGAQDTVSRHGGHEFVLIVTGIDNDARITRLCEQISAAMDAPFLVLGQSLHVSCSIGVARYPFDASDAVTLLRYADMALSQARQQGGRQHRFFTAAMNQQRLEQTQMEAALRIALAQEQLQLRYQPVADLQTGRVCALEAFVRWQHPEMGLIDARRFIPLAESCGLTMALGHWIVRRALADMQAWAGAGLAPVRVAINLSPKQFRDPDLVRMVDSALRESGVAPALLSLEITEAALDGPGAESDTILARLKALGVGLALDDFGTGYSSLNHLKRFPLDLIKIDCDLIDGIVSGTDEEALVKTIIAMAHHLGMQVSAEGVESEAQCDFLRRHMCDQIQGYFFGAPCDAGAIASLLAEGHALPSHLLRIQKQARTLLLVDDEQNIVSSLKRLLRRDGYQILTAQSGQEGLDLLAVNDVDVIVSDQRMPGMIGADFLRAAKNLYPDTIRIMLSGYTELQSVTDAVNEGAIFKFLTKPWDDEQLRHHIAEAFRLKEIADDNERLNLELRTANHELAAANRKMEDLLRQKQQQIARDQISLNVARELLQFVPLAVIGLDDDGMVAFVNAAADKVFAQSGDILGNEASIVLPELFAGGLPGGGHEVLIGAEHYQVVAHAMGANSQSRGSLLTLSPTGAHR